MENIQSIIIAIVAFTVISLASHQVGKYFRKIKLPLVSGYLFLGLLAGPYILGLVPVELVARLKFLDEIALAFIAFSAGSELYWQELKERLKSIKWVTIGLVVSTFTIGSLSLFYMSHKVPFMSEMSQSTIFAISLIAGAILVARSPSSAIAIIKELRAKGPFTQTILGVTVISDVVVIVLFSLSLTIADAIITTTQIDLTFALLLLSELVVSVLLGVTVGYILIFIVSRKRLKSLLKIVFILATGYGVYYLSSSVKHYSELNFESEILLEPILICMIGGFFLSNFSVYREEFLKLLHDVASPVYIAFFTLTGAALEVNLLQQLWPVTISLFLIRMGSIFLGAFVGGLIARDPMSHNKASWMAYLTQAGVGLGLAKEVAIEFPEWGASFATLMISVIVINQILGPVFFKFAVSIMKEAHPRAKKSELGGIHNAIIFGNNPQAHTLALQLHSHAWRVKIASTEIEEITTVGDSEVKIHPVKDYSLEELKKIGGEEAGAIVTLLNDDDSYAICEVAFENFGAANLVVLLNDRANFNKFRQLGSFIVMPSTAIVSLLDHFVRSPSAVSLLLGMEGNQDIIDIQVRNPHLYGMTLRELRLPKDILILSVNRQGQVLNVHGHLRFKVGDKITLIGSLESLEEMRWRFDA